MNKFIMLPLVLIAIHCTAQKSTQRVAPAKKEGIYSIRIQNQVMEINPDIGGRITSLKLNGKDFFTGKEVNAAYWGSTFWPSPQNAWHGPVSPVLDNQSYAVSVKENVIKLVSQKDPQSGYIFTKEISGNHNDRCIRRTTAWCFLNLGSDLVFKKVASPYQTRSG